MRRTSIKFACVLSVLLINSFCEKSDTGKVIVRIGPSAINQKSYDAYGQMRNLYPTEPGKYFAAGRPQVAALTVTELLYDHADGALKTSIKESDDWRWKRLYFPAQLYVSSFLERNLCFSESEINRYYKAHLDSFKAPAAPAPVKNDSLKKAESGAKKSFWARIFPQKKKSPYRPLDEVRSQIVRELFMQKYPPDSAFLASMARADSGKKVNLDSLKNTRDVKQRWLYSVSNDLPYFFIKIAYQELYGKPYRDTLSEIVGDGKALTDKDFETVLQWIPPMRRGIYNTPAAKLKLARYLLGWKLFTDQAQRRNLLGKDEYRLMLDWAWKFQVANQYLERSLMPEALKKTVVDTALCKYACWDQQNAVTLSPDTAALRRTVEQYRDRKVTIAIDSVLYEMRKKAGVIIVSKDIKDAGNEPPAVQLARADSLRDAGNADQAQGIYSALTTSFPFAIEGRKAFSELAKIQTEKGEYLPAIENYRFYSLLTTDAAELCKTMFMIGFIYDEYLDKPQLAEANYKWILKNGAGCELVDDVEFMCLHLHEPMCSVEELQAQAKRQGRSVDSTGAAATLKKISPDSGAAKK
ncbi:MAG: hypothetical protein PHC61_09005 [Chitinivibrionales bacterium]|nr:hypothetical protein [Chitinivibrionales bacterium]